MPTNSEKETFDPKSATFVQRSAWAKKLCISVTKSYGKALLDLRDKQLAEEL